MIGLLGEKEMFLSCISLNSVEQQIECTLNSKRFHPGLILFSNFEFGGAFVNHQTAENNMDC